MDPVNVPLPCEITEDLKCIRCSYNLCGLTADSRCPECGTSIEATIQGDLRAGDPRWAARVHTGATLVLIGFIPLLFAPVWATLLDPLSPAPPPVIYWIPWLLACLGLSLGGFFLSHPLAPGMREGRAARYLREATRFLSILFFARGGLMGIMQFAQPSSSGLRETMSRIDLFFVPAGFVLLFSYLALLARRIRRPSLARHFLAMLLLLPGAALAMIGLIVMVGNFSTPPISGPWTPSFMEHIVIYLPVVLVSLWFSYLIVQFRKAIRPASRKRPATADL